MGEGGGGEEGKGKGKRKRKKKGRGRGKGTRRDRDRDRDSDGLVAKVCTVVHIQLSEESRLCNSSRLSVCRVGRQGGSAGEWGSRVA